MSRMYLINTSPILYTLGKQAECFSIFPSVPLPGTSRLTLPVQRGFTVSVGAPSSHVSVPRCQHERRRLHQIFGIKREHSVLQRDQMGQRAASLESWR